MKITFITVSAPGIKNLVEAGKDINQSYSKILDLNIYYGKEEMSDEKRQQMIEDIKESNIVFVDLMGSPSAIVKDVYIGLEQCNGNIIPYGSSAREYMRLGSFTMESMKSSNKKMDMAAIEKMRNAAEMLGKVMPGKMRDMRNYSNIMKYFKVADKSNIKNMLYLLLRDYGNIKELPKPLEPREVDEVSICNPENLKFYKDYGDYERDFPFDNEKPIVVMLFYGHTYPTDTSSCVGQIKERIEEFANVLPVAVSGAFVKNEEKIRDIILNSTKNPIDIILNFMSFRLGAGPMGGDSQAGINLLEEVGAPYFHPYFMSRRTVKEWEESTQGCSTSEVLISVMLPELDGCIETYPIGAMTEPKYDSEFDIMTDELTIIEERVDKLVSRIKSYILLRKKKNEEKKVAIICYNYPPGESNLFGGAFLDTFASVENIFKNLKDNGYNLNAFTKEELMDKFTAGGIVNSGKYSDDWDNIIKYKDMEYKKELEKSLDGEEIITAWGQVPGTIMSTENNEFLIPGIVEGNIFLGLQPTRGIHEDVEKAYHDKTLPPHHQYLAFYKWIKDEFKADVIIHVGTHGTLEFLKGKECGMSGNCYPDRLISDIPHMYLYYCGNPAEGTIAKRRSHGNLIGYQPPVFIQGELYGDFSKLMSMIDNYHQSLLLAPQTSKDILGNILELAEELNLPKDIVEIESELYRMQKSLIPKGLHIFGKGYNQEEAREYAKGLLRYNRNGIFSVRELVAKSKGYNLDFLLDNNKYEIVKDIDEEAEKIIDYYFEYKNIGNTEISHSINKDELKKSLEFGLQVTNSSQENHEIKGLLRVLGGHYNPAKLAGDIYRHPEILPTGYNLYQFDPRLIPTKTAYIRGEKICLNTLESYKEEEGEYPLSTAVILWGLETSRTQGETFSQILAYLGVKVSDKGNMWEPKFDIIPIEELGRPRIDVTINICGFFRDMFPNLITSLSEIFEKIWNLEETDEENYFKRNSKEIYKKLIDEGYDEKEAEELAISRIFGPKEGGYGTGITGIIETKNWEDEEQLGKVYISSLQYIYNEKSHGKKVEGLYEENLKSVEIISQIRSNHEYEITDLDHYYEFFGGLSKSVEMVKGKKAKMYITDTTGERVISESVEKSIGRGIRTRVLNPKWIDGMLEHKYHGVQKIADRFENIMGLAATTNSVEEWIYEDMYNSYVEDEELRERLIENNSYAYMDILEQMTEYYNRGYWDADEEKINKIKELYLKLEDNIEESL
ncbi:cobaltochelatase subunit CobN [Tissierella pigra]|uniref:cobaltochelatase subunit CobN n=1 Tax=Tissierella pigra TaxID=2607614 RepID=UPI001C1208F9|nr:cobaltochelatase subunit CobN [Tissierella pigra]